MRFTSEDLPVLAIIGPSGAGKSTIIRRLNNAGLLKLNPTWTTRAKRSAEENNLEHYFVTEKEFNKKKKQNFFLETVEMFGLPFKYGLPSLAKTENNKVSTVMLRANLIPLFKKYYPVSYVYQIEDHPVRLQKRILLRQKVGEDIGSRISDIKIEIKMGRKIANRTFVNNSLNKLYKDLILAINNDFKF